MSRLTRAQMLALLLASAAPGRATPDSADPAALPDRFPPPAPPADTSAFGAGIQRTMTLLATSTPQKRHRVRVLFYGQSITAQDWTRSVEEDLRRRFPHADLTVENRAIGGFAAQRLVNSAEADLYPFYPDLVIFHVYGDHNQYEKILRRTRERTTAEILVQTDHVTRDADLTEETDPAKIKISGETWNEFMNFVHIPRVAKAVGAEVADLRSAWKAYLRANKLPAKALLSDSVHLNAHGCFLMAELIKPYLRYRPDHPKTAWQGLVRDEKPVWKNGVLTLEFEGNRVDLLAAPGAAAAAAAEIRIDGRRPSQFPELYAATRATAYPGTPWPVVMKTGYAKPRVQEEWTLRVTEADEAKNRAAFTLEGSVTGPDGSGVSTEPFVSKSGRVVIEPADWSLDFGFNHTKTPLPAGFTVRWKVVPLYADVYRAPANAADPAREYPVTVAQGLPGRKHTLEVVAPKGTEPPALATVRVYRPPLLP